MKKEDFKVTDNSIHSIKVKAIKDVEIVKDIIYFKKDEDYEFIYNENIDKYLIKLSILDGDIITLAFPKSYIDKYFYIEKESLVGRYLKALHDKPNGAGRYKKGEYIKIKKDNLKGHVMCGNGLLFGQRSYDWEDSDVELMPEGFEPTSKKSKRLEELFAEIRAIVNEK